jgi:hypothetical protein
MEEGESVEDDPSMGFEQTAAMMGGLGTLFRE